MSDYDDSTEHNISGEIRVYPCNTVDGHRARCLGARLHLGNAWHLPCLAERVSCFVRCGLEHAAHQHRAHGTGFLSAVMVFGRHRIGSGRPRYSLAEGNSTPPLPRRESNDEENSRTDRNGSRAVGDVGKLIGVSGVTCPGSTQCRAGGR